MGMEAAIRKDDAVITAYRAHGWSYTRGVSMVGVLAELTGTFHDLLVFCFFYLLILFYLFKLGDIGKCWFSYSTSSKHFYTSTIEFFLYRIVVNCGLKIQWSV